MRRPPECSTSSSTSPERAPYEDDTDFFALGRNDSQSSLGASSLRDSPAVAHADELERLRRISPISRLPAEILIGVFARLNMTADLISSMLVSKTWAKNCAEILWHRPLCTTWHKLKIVSQSIQSPDSYFNYASLVRRINLSNLSELVNDGSIQSFVLCKRLERLTLVGCRELTDAGVSNLIHGNRNLLALDMTGLAGITDHTLSTVGLNCSRIQGLNVTDCHHITDASLIEVAKNCHSVKRYAKKLKLNNCGNISDESVLKVAENCLSMLEIDLHQCKRITNASVTALIRKGRQLRELRVGHCHLLNDHAFLNLPRQMVFESLRILDLTACHHVGDAAVEVIIDAAPRLRNLVLAKCREITDRAVFAIAKLGRNLHYIHMGHCVHLTDASVKQLIKSCNRIRYIDLACCNHLTDDSVKELSTLPKLRRIGLVKCQSITNLSILAFAKGDSRRHKPMTPSVLERVHLSYCVHLTLQGIHALVNQCPRLTHLSLTGVQAFYGDRHLSAHCREAPAEFTDHQRSVFCVFSGEGVNRLRNYLNTSPHAIYRPQGAAETRIHDPTAHVNAMMQAAVINDEDDEFDEGDTGEGSQDGGDG